MVTLPHLKGVAANIARLPELLGKGCERDDSRAESLKMNRLLSSV
jgi:hypothetical protein